MILRVQRLFQSAHRREAIMRINNISNSSNTENNSTHPSKSSTIILDKIGHVTTIGINRPSVRNCVNSHTARLLEQAIEAFEADEDAYSGVLYGIGGNFCAGYDLKELSGTDSDGYNEDMFPKTGTMILVVELQGPTLRHLKKPMVAAIDGYAVAGGLELALMCDLRVMDETAIVGVYCRRFGVPLIDGGTVRLQAMIGLSRALDLTLTGRSVNAKEAFEWGLANRIVACGTALGQAITLASSLVKFPQKCLNADRDSVYNAAYNAAFNELVKFEQNNGIPIVASESVKGAQRFVNGLGRHGKFYNITEKEVSDWEKEYIKNSKL